MPAVNRSRLAHAASARSRTLRHVRRARAPGVHGHPQRRPCSRPERGPHRGYARLGRRTAARHLALGPPEGERLGAERDAFLRARRRRQGSTGSCRGPGLPPRAGMASPVREEVRAHPVPLPDETAPDRARTPVPKARRRGHLRGPILEHQTRREEQVPGPVPDWIASCCGARHRAPRPRVCRACAEDGLAPRSRRSEATRYARLGEHARAVAARRTAQGRSAWRQHEAGGSRGPCRGGTSLPPRPDGLRGATASRAAVGPAAAVHTVA